MSGPIDPLPAALPKGVVGLFTTRLGGVSALPYDELNLGLQVEDDADAVRTNRDLVLRHLGAPRIALPRQVHGAAVQVIESAAVPVADGVDPTGADALVSREPGTAIGVLVADCLPVLFADVVSRVIGVAHAGRKGLAAGVLQNAVSEMVRVGARVDDCVAVIGPGVCGRCYEVPAAMREEVAAIVPGTFATTTTGAPALDLAGGAEHLLRDAGIGVVHSTGICTMEDPRFYSYRRDGRTGRFAGIVMLATDD